MKILVTGHEGFIGSHVFNDLRHEQGYGYLVEGLDRPDDIGDWVGPSGMFAKHYDCIIHLAAYAALRDSVDNQSIWVWIIFQLRNTHLMNLMNCVRIPQNYVS